MRTIVTSLAALLLLALWPMPVVAGYTHYFTWRSQPEPDEIARCVERMSQVVGVAEDLVAGPDGAGSVEVEPGRLAFNGRSPLDHEPFIFPGQPGFNFCKTAYKPYDAVVTAVLITARDCFPATVLEISSDGPWPAWSEGAVLYAQAFGREPVTSLTEELGNMEYGDAWDLGSLLVIVLGFLVVFAYFLWFMRRQSRENADIVRRQREHVARSHEHMERVEELLGRLLTAVEKGPGAPSPD